MIIIIFPVCVPEYGGGCLNRAFPESGGIRKTLKTKGSTAVCTTQVQAKVFPGFVSIRKAIRARHRTFDGEVGVKNRISTRRRRSRRFAEVAWLPLRLATPTPRYHSAGRAGAVNGIRYPARSWCVCVCVCVCFCRTYYEAVYGLFFKCHGALPTILAP
jgi:hypothetical protein